MNFFLFFAPKIKKGSETPKAAESFENNKKRGNLGLLGGISPFLVKTTPGGENLNFGGKKIWIFGKKIWIFGEIFGEKNEKKNRIFKGKNGIF